MTHQPPIKLILFDLGGVLIELSGPAQMIAWSAGEFDTKEFWRRWLLSPAVREFEQGRIGPEQFADAVCREFKLPVGPDEFLNEFGHWPVRLHRGAKRLLAGLRRTTPLACLSNMNVIHWQRVNATFDLARHFDHLFVSHLTGKLKPDPEAFEQVMRETGHKAQNILFFDDNPLNVAAASKAGMQVRLAHDFSAARSELVTLGLVPGRARHR